MAARFAVKGEGQGGGASGDEGLPIWPNDRTRGGVEISTDARKRSSVRSEVFDPVEASDNNERMLRLVERGITYDGHKITVDMIKKLTFTSALVFFAEARRRTYIATLCVPPQNL